MRGTVTPWIANAVSRRQCGTALAALALASVSPWWPSAATQATAPPKLRLLGTATLPFRLSFEGTTVGGLSALDYDPVDKLWYALSDDRSDINPARFYTLRMDVSEAGLSTPVLQSVLPLRQADGTFYPNSKQPHDRGNVTQGGPIPDPEGLRFNPRTRTLLWSSEGNVRLGLPPFVREMTLDGKHLRELDTPSMLRTLAPGVGPRNNLGFEGLALSPDGRQVWSAMEGPLHQDGPEPTLSAAGGPCRLTCYDYASGRAVRQIAYVPDAVPLAPLVPGGYVDNGISEVLMLDARQMLVLERSYSLGKGNSLRLYQIDVTQGTNTLDVAQLHPGPFVASPKTLLANFSQTGLDRLDNTEGMAWGPLLPAQAGGAERKTLVFVSDDNFLPTQITQFVAFEWLG
jgi:hypothetical protein